MSEENVNLNAGNLSATDSGEQNPPAGSNPENNGTDNTQATDGANNQPIENNVPFNKHPEWIRREEEWKSRFNEQEARQTAELEKIRLEIMGNKTPKEQTGLAPIPTWWGGDESGWAEYLANEKAKEENLLTQAEERALKRFEADRTAKQQAQEKAQKDATDYLNSEVASIEANKELNPTGQKIDVNKLVKFVIDNNLVDSTGHWNYKAGFRFMGNQSTPVTTPGDRRAIAGAMGSDNKTSDPKSTTYKTAADFKRDKPW